MEDPLLGYGGFFHLYELIPGQASAPVGAMVFLTGVLNLVFPRFIYWCNENWNLSEWWPWDYEPSARAVAWIRAGGVALILLGIVIFIKAHS